MVVFLTALLVELTAYIDLCLNKKINVAFNETSSSSSGGGDSNNNNGSDNNVTATTSSSIYNATTINNNEFNEQSPLVKPLRIPTSLESINHRRKYSFVYILA